MNIKYAIMEIEENDEVVANIVSKCYVISEKCEYAKDDSYKYICEVVFPWSPKNIMEHINFHKDFTRTVPKYNFYFKCCNSVLVNQIFDSFLEASVVSEQLNKEILGHELGTIPINKNIKRKIEELKEKHDKTIKKYKKIEQIIEAETIDMEVTNNLVVADRNKQKIKSY